MGSIPLPALDVRPPAPAPDPMEQYGRLMQLRNMQAQQQMIPVQQQIMRQEAQSGQIGVEMQQREMASQSALMDAYANSGGDFDKAFTTAEKSGKVLPQDLIKLRQTQLQMQNEALRLVSTRGDLAVKQGDMMAGAADAVRNAPAQDRAQVYQQQIAQLGQAGVDISQVPQQYPGDQAFNMMWLGIQSHKQALANAQQQAKATEETAQAKAAQATTAQKQAETAWYAQNGGVPGVSTNAMQQADWLKKNPGKGPSDFLLWKQEHAPWAMMMNQNLLGGQNNEQALDFAANYYRQTGQLPSLAYRSVATGQAVIQRAAQLDAQQGGSGIAANKEILAANTASLRKLQTNYDQVQAFEGTAEKNIDLLQETAKNIPDLGARFANVPVRMLNARMLGTENMAKFNTALNTAQTEAAKVLNSSNATGVLSDSARHELQAIIDGNLSYKALVGSLNTLKQDMANRTQAYQLQIKGIQDRIKGAGTGAAQMQGGNQPQQQNTPKVTRYKIVNGQLVPE